MIISIIYVQGRPIRRAFSTVLVHMMMMMSDVRV